MALVYAVFADHARMKKIGAKTVKSLMPESAKNGVIRRGKHMKAKTFKNTCAQGDVMFIRKPDNFCIPSTAIAQKPEHDGTLIVTRSETLHHHTVLEKDCTLYQDAENPLLAWIKVNRPTVLEHQRPHDTHAPIKFAKGVYEVRRQREYTPEGWRRVVD